MVADQAMTSREALRAVCEAIREYVAHWRKENLGYPVTVPDKFTLEWAAQIEAALAWSEEEALALDTGVSAIHLILAHSNDPPESLKYATELASAEARQAAAVLRRMIEEGKP